MRDIFAGNVVFRKSVTCLPNCDESSSDSEDRKINECLPRTASNCHKAKVVRKSRKSRNQKAFSFNCKQTSVGIQTESNEVMMVGTQQPRSACDHQLVSTSTQTDDVIVIAVSQQLHASSDVSDGLFKSGHSGLLPAIRESDSYPVSCDRDTDSGHMSDTENKLLSAAVELIDHSNEELNKGRVVYKPSSTISGSRVSEEANRATVVEDTVSSAGSVAHGNWRQSNVALIQKKTSTTLCRKMSSTERCQLSRWTTATRLDVLDENSSLERQPKTFFASLETFGSQQTALNDVDLSGISVLSNCKESNVPLSACGMLSVNSQTGSSIDGVSIDLVSSNNNQSQLSPDAHCHVTQVSRQPSASSPLSNSSNGTVTRPSVDTHRRVSKGTPQSRGKPRLSVGRKSLSKRRSIAIRDKCYPPTKISRPAAWLMSATKTSRSKVQ